MKLPSRFPTTTSSQPLNPSKQGRVLSPLQLESSGAGGGHPLSSTPEEAKTNETTPATGKKTWVFQAENVRDFAFAFHAIIWELWATPAEIRRSVMSFTPTKQNRCGVVIPRTPPHDGSTQGILLTTPTRSHFGQWTGWRHGISHDLLQRASPPARWHLLGHSQKQGAMDAFQIWVDFCHHPRGRAQLLSHDCQ